MPATRVLVVPGPSTVPSRHRVKRNILGFLVSMTMLVNILSMPMKAYFSELPPWATLSMPTTYANDSDFSAYTLASMQATYDDAALPPAVYYDDRSRSVQVMRQVVVMDSIISDDDCLARFLVGKPIALYYGVNIRNVLCAFAAANHSLDTMASWDRQGACMHFTYVSFLIGHNCVWLRAGNEIDRSTAPRTFTIVAAHAVYEFPTWYWFKFIYRVCLSGFVLYLMWTKYYVHCLALEDILERYGHRDNRGKPGRWRYEVVYGDPTAIILMHPGVTAFFFLDCWFSVETLSVAIPRASQSADVGVMLLGFMYLSRTVWYAYAAMCVTASYLKRRRMEHAFSEVDPTIVAITATLYGPAITWAMGNYSGLLAAYLYLFQCTLPAAAKGYSIEGGLCSVLYTISIACIPILYGYVLAARFRGGARVRTLSSLTTMYASFNYNSIKTKAVFALLRWIHPDTSARVPEIGGSVYRLFATNARYKRSPTIGFRSADCFVYCYKDNVLVERLRLSLLESLDRNLTTPSLAVLDAVMPSDFNFNVLETTSLPCLARARRPTSWSL